VDFVEGADRIAEVLERGAAPLAAGASPHELRDLLDTRIVALEKRLKELEAPVPGLPRLFLLESEYQAAVVRAEIAWLKGVTRDLKSGKLSWSAAWLRKFEAEWSAAAERAKGPEPGKKARSPRTK